MRAIHDIREQRTKDFERTSQEKHQKALKDLEERHEARKRTWRQVTEQACRLELEARKTARMEVEKEEKDLAKKEEEEEDTTTTTIRLQEAKTSLNAARKELSILNVQKVDLIWLLKRVIKAEEKERL